MRQQKSKYADYAYLKEIGAGMPLTKDTFNKYVREEGIKLPDGSDVTNTIVVSYDNDPSDDGLEYGPRMEIPPELLFSKSPQRANYKSYNALDMYVKVMKPSKFFYLKQVISLVIPIGFVSCRKYPSLHISCW